MSESIKRLLWRPDLYLRIGMAAIASGCALAPVIAGTEQPWFVARVVVVVSGASLAALALARFGRCSYHQAALVVTLPLLPIIAIVCALVTFLIRPAGYMAPIASCVVAVLLWVLAADLCCGLPTAERCNQSSHGELQHRLTQLKARLHQAKEIASSEKDVETRPIMQTADAQASDQVQRIEAELNTENALAWVLATGYINLWKRLHRAEEALIEVLPDRTVIAGALYDELRLLGSKIENREELLVKLRHGVIALDPCAMDFLKLSVEESRALKPPVPAQDDPCPGKRHQAARALLRMVRRALNEYRDDRYDGLVVSRNRSLGTTIFTGLTACMLLAIPMIMGASRGSVVAGATFYFVGATIGLLSRLRSQSQEEGDVADYGLSTARLYSTPLFCGLAAVGGVLLVATLPYATNAFSPKEGERLPSNVRPKSTLSITNAPLTKTNSLASIQSASNAVRAMTNPSSFKTAADMETQSLTNPIPTATNPSGEGISPADTENKPRPPALTDIFDLEKNLVGVLVAAVFGLTPGLLFNRLQQQAEKCKSEIKTSEASQGPRQT